MKKEFQLCEKEKKQNEKRNVRLWEGILNRIRMNV